MCKKLILFLFLLLTACTQPVAPPQRLRISFNAFPNTSDPRKSSDFVSATLICMIYEGLTRCLSDGSVELALAERVEISSDRLSYTFHLRPSVWGDGTPVTAYDFEKSWKQILDPSFGSLSAYLFYPIKNAERCYKEGVSQEEIGIRALDSATLEVILERPTSYFLSLTAFPCYLPACSHDESQTNGPFSLARTKQNTEILLKKNDLYWNREATRLEEIQISIVSNESTALKMFARGELDWLGGAISPIPTDSLESLRKRFDLRFQPMAATTFCAFQTRHPLLQNRHLRQALSLAINRSEIVEQITQMGETAATRCIPPSLMGFRNKTLYQPFDAELARLHLEKAMQELGVKREELQKLTLTFRAAQKDALLAQAIQRQWKETLGIDVLLDKSEPQVFKERLHRRDFCMALSFWIAQFSDPVNILERFQDEGNFKNYPGWHNSAYQTLVQKIYAEGDELTRFGLIESAEQLLLEEMPFAPIYHWSNPHLCHPSVRNLQSTPNGGILFERCWLVNRV